MRHVFCGAAMSATEEENDPAALLVAALREATEAAKSANAAATATHQVTLETQGQLSRVVPSLEQKVAALVHRLQVMTPRREALRRARVGRYIWAAGGFLLGLLLGVSVLLLAVVPRLPG